MVDPENHSYSSGTIQNQMFGLIYMQRKNKATRDIKQCNQVHNNSNQTNSKLDISFHIYG